MKENKNTFPRQKQRQAARNHFKELVRSGCIWLPSELQFRDVLNELAVSALDHFLKHGDANKIKAFILSLPKDVDKLCVAEYFAQFASITYGTFEAKLNIRMDRSDAAKNRRLKPQSKFNLFSEKKLSKLYVFDLGDSDDSSVQMHSKEITKTEFVQFILDSLVEKRRLFTRDDIEEISMILDRISLKAH